MKKLLSLALVGMLALAACGGTSTSSAPASGAAGAGGLVGIAMPTKSSARWIADGDNLVKALTAIGYTTDLQYAEDDIPTQVSQVENMITKGAKVLVIAAIDGTTLTDTLQKAHDAGIKVLAYDRLIRNSPNVDYYTTFDNFNVGVLQAGSIDDCLDLKNGKGPFNIELFAGSPDDNNAGFFFNGAMSILQPYHRQRQARRPEQAGQVPRGSRDPALGRRDRPGSPRQHPGHALCGQGPGRGPVPVRRHQPWHDRRVQAGGLLQRRQAGSVRQRTGRRAAARQVDPRR